MTVSPTVWDQLQESPTLQGYNDGLSAGSGLDDGLERRLSPKVSPRPWLLFRRDKKQTFHRLLDHRIREIPSEWLHS